MSELEKYNIFNAPKVPLTELIEHIVDNRGKTVPTTTHGVKLIATNCIRNEYLYPRYNKVRLVSDEVYHNWFRSHPVPGDIIFVNKGTPGRTALVPDPIDFCIAQDMMAFHVNPNKVYNKYLLAVLRSDEVQQFIFNNHVGTLIPHFKKEQLRTIMIPLPEMEIQNRIGDLYFNISEKIENNNRINRNLEEQAQALFKSWFVDFEPWGGTMPEDWKEGALGDIIEEQPKSKIQVNAAKDVKGKYPFFTSGSSIYEYNEALISGRNLYLNTGGAAGIEFYVGEAAYSTDTWCIKGIDDFTDFLYLYITSIINIIDTEYFEGSALKHLKKKPFKERKIIIPANKIKDDFNKKVVPIFDIIMKNYSENKRLATLRDALLPKLMKGEIAL